LSGVREDITVPRGQKKTIRIGEKSKTKKHLHPGARQQLVLIDEAVFRCDKAPLIGEDGVNFWNHQSLIKGNGVGLKS